MTERSNQSLEQARLAAGSRRWAEAFKHFGEADASDSLNVDDLDRFATAAYLLGHTNTAVDALTRRQGILLASGEVQPAVRCGIWIILMLLNSGGLAEAGGWIGRTGHLLDSLPTDSAERGYMLALHAFRSVAVERQFREGHAMAEASVEIGHRHDEEDLVALSLNVSGRALIWDGQPERGLERLDEAMVAVVSGALSPIVAGIVYCSLIEACEEISDYRRSSEWTEALTRWCDGQQGLVTFTGQCLTHRAHLLRRQGRLAAAEQEARDACQRFVGAGDEAATGSALYELAEICRVRGDFGAAEDAFRRAGGWGKDPQPGLALLRLAQGDTAAAASAMRRSIGETARKVKRLKLLPAYVEVMLAVGDEAAAEEAARELSDLADLYNTEAVRAEAALARGAVALRAGDASDALSALRNAEKRWRLLGAPYETARAKLLIGRACERLGDIDSAKMEGDAARQIFADLGATVGVDYPVVEDGLESHGLTDRELEVLRLVATGTTNQAIAEKLHLSTKTIDRHVGNILTKLGVTSRTAATAFAYQHQML